MYQAVKRACAIVLVFMLAFSCTVYGIPDSSGYSNHWANSASDVKVKGQLMEKKLVALDSTAEVATADAAAAMPLPIDPQIVKDQEDMTADDFVPVPGKNWADPALKPEHPFKIALVAVYFPDQPFVITMPKNSDKIGNPQIDPVALKDVPEFYKNFLNTPSDLNHGHTINGYWMEQSKGKFGITRIDTFGPYLMPHPLWWYGLNEWGQNAFTPEGPDKPLPSINQALEKDVDAAWAKDKGQALVDAYKNTPRADGCVLRLYAGYDETSVWQEFGEMKFNTKEDITPEFGNPNPALPGWAATRYVPWTSWWAASQQWGLSSLRQGESSGTITHEIGHFAYSIGDLNNNPYVTPYRRVAVGPWDMMDRGSFNGPGGPHNRWEVPATYGGSMPAPLMLRNRMKNGFVPDNEVLYLSRNGLAQSGPVVADVTARSAAEVLPGTFNGIKISLDGAAKLDGTGDRFPYKDKSINDPSTNPLSPGLVPYNFYTMEVVQRIGYDSYCPDNGVLIALNKDNEDKSSTGYNGGPNAYNSFIWAIDAHPEDIKMVDYVKPDGTKVMRTIADYRQTNDALFHAGTNSGSRCEYEDTYNKLHFYVLDLKKNADGILSYKLGIRSTEGAGPQTHGIALNAAKDGIVNVGNKASNIDFALKNTGKAKVTDPSLHSADYNAYMDSDIYRLKATVVGDGWHVQLQNAFAAVEYGDIQNVPVYVAHDGAAAASATVTLTATSESDPTKTASVSVTVAK